MRREARHGHEGIGVSAVAVSRIREGLLPGQAEPGALPRGPGAGQRRARRSGAGLALPRGRSSGAGSPLLPGVTATAMPRALAETPNAESERLKAEQVPWAAARRS